MSIIYFTSVDLRMILIYNKLFKIDSNQANVLL